MLVSSNFPLWCPVVIPLRSIPIKLYGVVNPIRYPKAQHDCTSKIMTLRLDDDTHRGNAKKENYRHDSLVLHEVTQKIKSVTTMENRAEPMAARYISSLE